MDEHLLLALQYATIQAGTKLPYIQANQLVTESVTEGAIVLHSAKMHATQLGRESVPLQYQSVMIG